MVESTLAPLKDVDVKNAQIKNQDAKKREKLLKIQKREKLKELLIKKFRQKYPNANGGDIAIHVQAAVCTETIGENDLADLEKVIRKVAGIKSKDTNSVTLGESKSDSALLPSANNQGRLHTAPSKKTTDIDVMVYDQFGTPREYTTTIFKTAAWDDDWSKISKMKKTEYEMYESKRKEILLKRRSGWKKALDSHIQFKAQVRDDEMVKKAQYKVDIEEKTKEWQLEELRKQEKIREVNIKVKQERAEQLRALREAKERQLAFEKKHDLEMARRIKESVEEDKNKETNRLIEQKRRLKEFLLQNEVNKVILEKKKQELIEEDKKILRASEESAIKRERQRAFEESERQRKMKERVKVVEHSDVMQKGREQEKKDIERMIRIQKEHEINENAKEMAKKKKRVDNNNSNTDYLKKQIAWRKEKAAQLEVENAKFAVLYKAEAVKAIQEEKVKSERRKALAIENRKAISSQIENKVVKKLHPVLLSETERKLNTTLLKRLDHIEEPQDKEFEVKGNSPLKPW